MTIIGRGGCNSLFHSSKLKNSDWFYSNIRAHGQFGAEYHGDHSYEVNPPSYTLLRMVKTPPSGGDTIFTSQTALFDKLSPTFQKTFEGLHAIHSSDRSYVTSINGGGTPHRAPIATAHPLVWFNVSSLFCHPRSSITNFVAKIRTHPVTRLKSLNYNPTFIELIEELNGQESHYILAFLRENLLNADDLTARWKWTPGAVAFWDNRVVIHKAVPGGYDVSWERGSARQCMGKDHFLIRRIVRVWLRGKRGWRKKKKWGKWDCRED